MTCPKCGAEMSTDGNAWRCFICGKRVYIERVVIPPAPVVSCSLCKKPMEFDGKYRSCPDCRAHRGKKDLGQGKCPVCGEVFQKKYYYQKTCLSAECASLSRTSSRRKWKEKNKTRRRPQTSAAECLPEQCSGGAVN